VQVRVLVGDPVPVADLLRRAALEQWPDARLYRSITARIADSLSALKVRLAALGRRETSHEAQVPIVSSVHSSQFTFLTSSDPHPIIR
jgi:hypothetical protein